MNGIKTNRQSAFTIKKAKQWLSESECIFFTSGAGLTAAAGINYADKALFSREFPAMLQYGFQAQYQVIGFNDWPAKIQWGYWAAHVDLVRFQWPKTKVYQNLHQLAQHLSVENTFVMTSNVDAMFERNDFDPNRIYTPQGNYAFLQCTTPCTQDVWPWKDQIDKIKAATNPKTQALEDKNLIPKCPNCGGTVFPNVRVDDSFIHQHFDDDAKKLQYWLNESKHKKGLIIEVGAGFNTPSVIRWPSEEIVNNNPNWKLLRINMSDASIPDAIQSRAIGLLGDAKEIIAELSNT
jgi:NAD-dependent SIR2 family protein deacetylase